LHNGASPTFPIPRLKSMVAARATSLPGDAAGDHLPIAKFMAVDLGRHSVQPLAARTVTSSIKRSPLFSTDLSASICF
jgi:hypothetical protein